MLSCVYGEPWRMNGTELFCAWDDEEPEAWPRLLNRIVLAGNACAGIPDKALKPGLLAALLEWAIEADCGCLLPEYPAEWERFTHQAPCPKANPAVAAALAAWRAQQQTAGKEQ